MELEPDPLTSFTQSLVRTRSITGAERQAVQLMASEMHRLRFDRVWIDEFGSLVGLIEGTHPGPTMLLDGHCDTVEAHSPDWVHDPWGGLIEGGRLYGRGSADMKGSLAAMIHAVGTLRRENLHGRVAVSATVSEETAEGGSMRPVVEALRPELVVIGEATQFNLNRGGRGRAEIRLTTRGRSAHSSSPAAGRCAVTDMLRVIHSIAGRPVAEDPLLGPASIVLTDIVSEPHPGRSVIPYRCHVTYDRRLLPGEKPDGVLHQLTGLPNLEDVEYQAELADLEERTYSGAWLRGEKFFPAWVFPETHPFVRDAVRGLESVGLKPRLGAYRFCTNAAYSAGTAGIPTIGFGIGREQEAHTVDESIALEDLLIAARGYQGIILAACRG
jgi:putative selenium metabolism hydrolase